MTTSTATTTTTTMTTTTTTTTTMIIMIGLQSDDDLRAVFLRIDASYEPVLEKTKLTYEQSEAQAAARARAVCL